MTALEKLFASTPPKKNGGVGSIGAASKPAQNKKSDGNKMVCSECGKSVWPFQQKDGVCNDCRPNPKKAKKANPAPKQQATPKKETSKMSKPKVKVAPKPKSEGRKAGLSSDRWHDEPATFAQTSFLKKYTGLKTWDLEKPLTKLQASELISAIKDSEANIPRVAEILEQLGCEPYVRPGSNVRKATKSEAKAASKDAEIAELKKQLAEMQDMIAKIAG
jgi:hypothetical protein